MPGLKKLITSAGIAMIMLGGTGFEAEGFPLTEQQQERLQRYIPRTHAKLIRREPVLITGLGDGITRFKTEDGNKFNLLLSYLGRFAHRLEREFFYTGGVEVLNPPLGKPRKLHDHVGPEITIQTLAEDGAVAFRALQRLMTDAFLNDPDLIFLAYGLNDALYDYPIEDFETALEGAVAICQERGVDVIILGSPVGVRSKGPTGLGLTRPYANAARQVALRREVLFVDLGSAMIEGVGAAFALEPEVALNAAAANVRRHFEPGVNGDALSLPTAKSHEFLGDRIYRELFFGAAEPSYLVTGWSTLGSEGVVEVEFALVNRTEEYREGFIATLDSGPWLTSTNPYHRFQLKPGEAKAFRVNYQMQRSPIYVDDFAFERWGSRIGPYLPVLVTDDIATKVTGFVPVARPFQAEWLTGFQDEVREAFKVGCRLRNTAGEPIKGDYTVTWGDQETKGEFNVPEDGVRELQFTMNLPTSEDALAVRQALQAVFRINGQEFPFRREIEAIRNLSLGQRIPLVREDLYQPNAGLSSAAITEDGVSVRTAANDKALFVIYEIPKEIEFQQSADEEAIIAELTLDARSYGSRREFGFVDIIRVGKDPLDGEGRTQPLGLSALGTGYNKALDEKGITSTLRTLEDGTRRFTVAIPRHFMHLHEWQLGNPNSLLGFLPAIKFLKVDEANPQGIYPRDRRYIFLSSRLAPGDPRGLPVLELSESGTGRWSVRIY